MAQVVAVHGVGQQFKGEAIIHREWYSAFLDGLRLAGHGGVGEADFVCPFYGHMFRRAGALSTAATFRAQDVTAEEAKLLKLFWLAASQAQPDAVPSPKTYETDQTLARVPRFVQRALNALSRSRFWAHVSQALLIGDVKQTFLYLSDPDLHEKIVGIVLEKITAETRVVIGHSLGSVVGYEALCRKSEGVVSFISLGSPLGIRELIFDKLTPRPGANGFGAWPGHAKHWANIADAGDLVALQKQLAPLFGNQVQDILVYNGSDAHHGERYLTSKECGTAVRAGLWQENS